ncbi:hypothetical protein EON82_24570 [bacterium]|nr:MAG: hypothetical protein EON82_24570 [bacterium]
MRPLVLAAFTVLSAAALGQTSPRPIRIAVRHADPYAIKAMLEGQPIVSPEISTLLGRMGQPAAAGAVAAASNLLMGGVLFVNPTDNSLWWYPKASSVRP